MTEASLKLEQMRRIKAAGHDTPRLTRFLAYCAIDWGIIVGSYAIAANYLSALSVLFALVVIANRQHALSALVHEGAHYLATRNRRVNDNLTLLLCSLPLGIHLQPYRKFHFAHHRLSGKPQDPELKHISAKASEWSGPLTLGKLGKLVFKDIFLFQGIVNIIYVIQLTLPSQKQGVVISGYMIVFHGLMVLSGHWLFSALWFGALWTFYWAFFRIRIWTEHRGSNSTHRIHLSWLVGELLSPHHMWYHYEHHVFPQVPCFNLFAIREIIGPAPKVISIREWYQQLQTLFQPLIYEERPETAIVDGKR